VAELHSVIWLIPLLPLLAGLVCGVLPTSARTLSFTFATGSLSCSLLLSLSLLYGVAQADARMDVVNFTWLAFGNTELELGFLIDPLTAVMVAMVSFVSLLIFVYSHGYMRGDKSYARFFSFLSLFCAGMLGLCVANSLLLLFMSWELVGLCSYLLIGFWFHKSSAAAAAKKAFIVTKIGDVGFLIGILWLYAQTGTQLLYDGGDGLLDASTLTSLAAVPTGFFGMNLAGVLALLIFCGAVGKSGQFPLHVWLPDAMEGPTPVSALIHAATMVAAGVFLVGRMDPLFQVEPLSLTVVAWLGAFTALFAATIAVAQRDIKRILAYSTVSQLGFMMLGLGVGGVVVGIFHLITHAFFKALLFLGSGSVIHGCAEEQDIFKMGGLRTSMKTTFITYVIGALALAGIFPLAGFWSKDEILRAAYAHGHGALGLVPFALAMVTAFLTAFYMTRQVALVFFGEQRSDDYHPHESPRVMTVPLVILAVFAVGLGFIGTPWANAFRTFLAGPSAHDAPSLQNVAFMVIALLFPLAGIGVGWRMYGSKPLARGEPDPLGRIQPLFRWLENRWYFDELYRATVGRLVALLAMTSRTVDALLDRLLAGVGQLMLVVSKLNDTIDESAVQGAERGVAASVRTGSRGLSRLQGGHVQSYLSVLALGAVLLIGLYLWALAAP
jgi:NADH-quinone oxidoreductase subunit L